MQPIVREHQFHTELFLDPIWIEDWGKDWHLPCARHCWAPLSQLFPFSQSPRRAIGRGHFTDWVTRMSNDLPKSIELRVRRGK